MNMNSSCGCLLAWTTLVGVLGAVGCGGSPTEKPAPDVGADSGTTLTRTEVKLVNGRPTLLVNGAEVKNLMMTDVYHYRDNLNAYELPYGDDWVAGIKIIIDDAASLGTQVVSLPVWWNEIDKAKSRPTPVTANLDFSPVDQVMSYAAQKKVSIMLSPEPHKMIPRWWAEENNLPPLNLDRDTSLCIPKEKDAEVSCIPKEICGTGQPCCTTETTSLYCCTPVTETRPGEVCSTFAKIVRRRENGMISCAKTNLEPYKTCDFCATDAFGWKYPFSSMGNDKMRADYSEYLRALIDRYKNHPALFGWEFTLGAMGEDAFGDYTEMLLFGRAEPGQVSDYSPYFARELFKWLTEKYKTNAALREAWGDSAVDLGKPAIPLPLALFKSPADLVELPECLNPGANPTLTQAGKDFCDFRELMRDTDRRTYVSLFKDRDPAHVVIYGSSSNNNVLDSSKIDGCAGNPNLAGRETGDSYDVSSFAMEIARAKAKNKVMFFGAENGCGEATENANQLLAIERFGKAVKCFGGIFGYVSEIRKKTNGERLTCPSWTSAGAKQAIRNIASYAPGPDCATAYSGCGNGTCDGPETKTSCPQDCH